MIGTATIDFGVSPGSNEASVTVTGQTTISATSKCENIRAAADRLKLHPSSQNPYIHLEEKFGLSYNLDTDSEEEVQS